MRTFGSRTAFYALCVLMSPATLIGYLAWVGKIVVSGRSGVSSTAQGPLAARFTEHNLGTRSDPAADRLLWVLPGGPRLGLRLTAGPLFLAHRITGYVPKAFRYPFEGTVSPQYEASARIEFFDAAVDAHLSEVAQFVILGAGFDTRAYRLPADASVRVFEVDSPPTLAVKRRSLDKAGIDARGVTFVPADFEKQDWLSCLTDAGFDPRERTLFLWEGVTMYLDRAAVEDTLRRIASTAPGSVVAFDYFTTEPLTSRALYWRYGRAATAAAGEPLKFGVDSTPPARERLAELLHSCGLTLSEHRTLGEDTADRRAWGGFATATVAVGQARR
jgi:methyltransferase (TIGR00027 family)